MRRVRPPEWSSVLASCGGSRGIVGDLLRDAANGLVRVIGNGDNHWPLVYGAISESCSSGS
jgi:hypothetical protein